LKIGCRSGVYATVAVVVVVVVVVPGFVGVVGVGLGVGLGVALGVGLLVTVDAVDGPSGTPFEHAVVRPSATSMVDSVRNCVCIEIISG
jgi:hypothetical protein